MKRKVRYPEWSKGRPTVALATEEMNDLLRRYDGIVTVQQVQFEAIRLGELEVRNMSKSNSSKPLSKKQWLALSKRLGHGATVEQSRKEAARLRKGRTKRKGS